MRRRLAAIVKRAWSEGVDYLIEAFLCGVTGLGLGGLFVGAALGAGGVRLGDEVHAHGLGQVLLGLLGGAVVGGGGGALLGALLGGALGVSSGFLIGSVELGIGAKDVVTTSLRARRTTGAVTEVAPALAPAGRGDEAASAPIPTLECGGNP